MAAVIVAACGSGAAEDEARVGDRIATTSRAPAASTTAVPADDPPSAPSSTEQLSPPPTRADGPAPPVTGRTVIRTGVANRSVVDHPGWRVTLTVGDDGEFGVDDTIPVEVVLTNRSARTAYHEVDQPDSVVITTVDDPDTRAWSHVECNPTLDVYKVPGGLRATEPGEDVPMIVRYPVAEECRLPPGEYLAFGQWSVCPDDALVETPNPGTYRCADGAARLVDAGPVYFRLR